MLYAGNLVVVVTHYFDAFLNIFYWVNVFILLVRLLIYHEVLLS